MCCPMKNPYVYHGAERNYSEARFFLVPFSSSYLFPVVLNLSICRVIKYLTLNLALIRLHLVARLRMRVAVTPLPHTSSVRAT